MQNTCCVHIFRTAFFLALGIVLALFVDAVPARAADYTMPHVDISAQVADNGDVHIVEKREFDFNTPRSAVRWVFGSLPSNATIQVNAVALQQVAGDNNAASSHTLSAVPFQADWRTSGGPGGEAYSWDGVDGALYVFFEETDESLAVTVEYTVVNGIAAYKDVGELRWEYVTADWDAESEDVTALVTLPVPEGQAVKPGDNVRAWGHGPADGRVAFNDDGSITYTASTVKPGQFAEARVVFPVSWLPNLSKSSLELHENEMHLADVIADEQTWADSENAQRVHAIEFVGLWFVLSLAVVAWALLMYVRWGREPQPRFTETYWRDVPDPDLSPDLIGQLVNGDFHGDIQGLLDARLVEEKSVALQKVMNVTAGAYFLVGLAAVFFGGTALPLLPVILTCLAVLVIARFMPRRTQRGVDVTAKCRALERWLKDCTERGEAPSADADTWDRLAPYAHALGMRDETSVLAGASERADDPRRIGDAKGEMDG